MWHKHEGGGWGAISFIVMEVRRFEEVNSPPPPGQLLFKKYLYIYWRIFFFEIKYNFILHIYTLSEYCNQNGKKKCLFTLGYNWPTLSNLGSSTKLLHHNTIFIRGLTARCYVIFLIFIKTLLKYKSSNKFINKIQAITFKL